MVPQLGNGNRVSKRYGSFWRIRFTTARRFELPELFNWLSSRQGLLDFNNRTRKVSYRKVIVVDHAYICGCRVRARGDVPTACDDIDAVFNG